MRSGEEARRFLQLLRQTVVELGISDAEMEKACCAATPTSPSGGRRRGLPGFETELKNMNSFKFVADGIAAEVERQIALYEGGGEVVQQTLHFDLQSGTIAPPAPRRRRTTTATSRADPNGAARGVVARAGRYRRAARSAIRADSSRKSTSTLPTDWSRAAGTSSTLKFPATTAVPSPTFS